MKKDTVFTTVKLPSGPVATIFDGYGRHMFAAQRMTQGDNTGFIACLMTQLVRVEGKAVTLEELEDMPLSDVSYLSEVVATMLDTQNIR